MNKDLQQLLEGEEERQDTTLNLIASENYPSREVTLALTSLAGSKYAEGYPGNRYYGGCATIDEIEQLAINQVQQLFGAQYANVQPHSGSNANLAVYFALLDQGDQVLAPSLDCGGHLTHGSPASVTSKLWQFEHYGVADTGIYDYDAIATQAKKFKPKLIIAGTSAYPRAIDWKRFAEIAKESGALLMADVAHLSGLIAGGVFDSPVDLADVVTMTTQKTLRGPRGGIILTNDAELAKKIGQAVFPGLQGGPHENVIAAKAQALIEASTPEFKTYASQIITNARVLADALLDADVTLWTKGTDTHLLNIDTKKSFDMDGKAAEQKLEAAGIVTNRETLPGDSSPLKPSGIRLGTPALTTRGMREAQMQKIAELIVMVLRDDESVTLEVRNLCQLFRI